VEVEMEMDIDPVAYIDAATRTVTNREHDGAPAHVVTAARTYDTDAEDLWDAITSAERLPRWFLPVSGDLRPGGRYQLQGNAGGEITACEPPRFLGVTWEYGGEVSWVTVELSADPDGGTRLALEHIAHVDKERWDQYGPGAAGVGWDMALMGLELHVATRAAVDPQAAEAWFASPSGRAFVERSSADWRRASIASGTDEEAATAAARRTSAFYTGAPEPPA
jgi:uncharacterized protein YndB with AHSA1/START domain